MESPPAKVLVAVEEELSPPMACKSPEIVSRFAKVEEAEERRLVKEESPFTASEEEAERAPVTLRLETKVEEACAASPPAAVMVNTVVVPDWLMFETVNASPVCPTKALRFRMFAVVEVAATVKTALVSAEVVPTATLSVKVWRRTKVPSSWKPETLEAEIAPQMMLPEASVVKALEEEQVGMVVIWMLPPATIRPEAKVEVAPVFV